MSIGDTPYAPVPYPESLPFSDFSDANQRPSRGRWRWGDFCSGKSHQNPPRAFPPRYLPWGTRLSMRQAGVRPVTLAVAPVSATTPSHHGNWPYDWVVSTSGPTLEERRSRRRKHGRTPCYAVVGAGLARPAATPALPWKIREGQAPPLRPKIKIRAACGTPQLFIIHLSFFISLANPLRCGILKKLYSLRRWALARRQRSPSILC